ncbi:MAG: GlsB/YeaQ/YmgE family stress response membrane protein [Microcoleaceae cyanobacterium]
MSLLEFLVLLIIAALCGSAGQSLVGYSPGGCLASIVVGLIGAYVGLWIARELALPVIFTLDIGGNAFPIVWSIIGAAVFAAILGLISRAVAGGGRRTRR